MSSKTGAVASALKSGAITGTNAILSTLNSFTPHVPGAVDIMVVEQPNGTLKSSPFYVRFGKYTPMRVRDKDVRILVNGVEASFSMHLGSTSQAYFAAKTEELVSDQEEDEQILSGMMSPPSGYSSGEEGSGAPYASADMLCAVQQEVARLKEQAAAAAAAATAAAAAAAASQGALGVVQGPPAAALHAATSSSNSRAAAADGVATAAVPSATPSLGAAGGEAAPVGAAAATLPPVSLHVRTVAGAPSAQLPLDDGSAADDESSSSLSDDDVPSVAELEQAVRSVLSPNAHDSLAAPHAAGGAGAGAAAVSPGQQHQQQDGQQGTSQLQRMLLDSEYSIVRRDEVLESQKQVHSSLPLPQAAAASSSNSSAGRGRRSRHGKPRSVDGEPAAAGRLGATSEPQQQQVGFAVEPKVHAASSPGAGVAQPAAGLHHSSSSGSVGSTGSSATRVAGSALSAGLRGAAQQQQQQEVQPHGVQQPQLAADITAGSHSSASMPVGAQVPAAAAGDGVEVGEAPSLPPSSVPTTPAAVPVVVPALPSFGGQVTCMAPAAAEGVPGQGWPAASAAVPVPVTPAATSAAAVGSSMLPLAQGSPSAAGLTLSSASPSRLPEVEGMLGASPGVLGTSPLEGFYGIGTPTGAAAGSGSSLALALGLQLSTCRGLLRSGMEPAEALAAFESQRLTALAWADQGMGLLQQEGGEALVVRLGDALYSWQQAAPLLLGLLAYGIKPEAVVGAVVADPVLPLKLPITKASSLEKKVAAAASSWRLWPFSGWREAAGAAARGSTPPLPPAAASASGSGTASRAASAPPAAESGVGQGSTSSVVSPWAVRAGAMEGAAAEGVGSSPPEGAGSGMPRVGSRSNMSGASPRRKARPKQIIIIRKTLMPTDEQLRSLPLRPGRNTITFRVNGPVAELTAFVYYMHWSTRLVISDVDGTITRSDLLGHVLPTLGVDWSHTGITQLFHNIAGNGYQIMFLSSRAIAQANITREYLHTLVQGGYRMPLGPVIISPHGLLPSLYREIVVRRPHEFKIACLQDIRALFPPDWNPFYAGFGNRDTDVVSYREVGVPLSRTFIINPKGQLVKASSTVQSSTWSSLSAINELVEEVFPYMEPGAPTSSLPPAAEEVVAPPAATAAAADTAGAGPQLAQPETVLPPQQLEGLPVISNPTAAAAPATAGPSGTAGGSSSSSVVDGVGRDRQMLTQDSRNDGDWAVLVGTGTVPSSSVPRSSNDSSRSSTDAAAATLPGAAAPGPVAAPSRGAASAAAAAAAEGGGGSPNGGKVDGVDAKSWNNSVAISAVAQGAAPSTTGRASAAGSIADSGPRGQSPPSTARASVGPAREEFNDNQFWRMTPLSFNVEAELQQDMRRRSGSSSAGGAMAGGIGSTSGSGFTTASSSLSGSRRASEAGKERGSSFGANANHH